MRLIKILFLVLPNLFFSQEIIKCNDSVNFIVKNIGSENYAVKVTGNIKQLQNPQVFVLNEISIIQFLINNTKNYSQNGNDELSIMASYIMSEGKYFSGLFKEQVNLEIFPENLTNIKKAVFWYFSLPLSVQSNSKNESKALKNVFITSVKNDEIITIGTTQFENQKLENIEKLLVDLTKNIEVRTDKEFCKK